MHAQILAAQAGLPGGGDRYLKIACEPRRTEATPVPSLRRAS